jgi:hypothetical protein
MQGVKLAGHIDVDDMRGHDLGPFGYIAAHVMAVCRSNHVEPRGVLTTRGLTSLFSDDVCIRWQLDLDLGWS